MLKISAFLFTILLLTSCGESNETKTIKTNDLYSLDIPTFLTEGTELSEDASLQYQNIFKELYVVVIDEEKTDVDLTLSELDSANTSTLIQYTDLLLNVWLNDFGIENSSQFSKIKINGLKAMYIDLQSVVENIPIYYSIVFIEGKDHYYQVLTWTLASRKDKYKEKMTKIVQSFKEL